MRRTDLARAGALLSLALALAACARTPAPSAPANTPIGYAETLARAEQEGALRVILRVGLAPGDANPLLGRDALMADLAAEAALAPMALTRDLPLLVAEMTPDQLKAMAAGGRVAAMMEDRLTFIDLQESAPQVGAPAAWRAGALGRGQAVAILDTGVDAGHPFFGGRVAAEACFSSPSEALNASSLCPDGSSAQIGPGAARPCEAFGCDHGTHVAGIAAGAGASARGIAPEAGIIAVQVFSLFTDAGARLPCQSSGRSSPCIASFTSDQIRALDHIRDLAADRAVAAVNMSLGGGRSDIACDGDFIAPSILALRALGVATVIAAGNSGAADAVSFPACVASAVTVGAVDRLDAPAAFTNRGPLVDLYAPGLGVRSSVPGGSFAAKSGTSMAAPHVAGAFAALKSARPGRSVEDLTFAIAAAGPEIDGRRRLDVAAALAQLPVQRAPGPAAALTLASRPGGAPLAEALRLKDRPADQAVRMLVRPRWPASTLTRAAEAEALERLAQAARARGARLVDPRYGQGLVVIEATPAQIEALARSGAVGAMQEEIRAAPQAAP